jgi:predicted metal-dependent phosphoesterase TrpH
LGNGQHSGSAQCSLVRCPAQLVESISAVRVDRQHRNTYSPILFTLTILEALKQLIAEGPAGNRWFKVNLHVHSERNDPADIVRQARAADIDLVAITDHQGFGLYDGIAAAASATPGRALTVLPGIEITSLEGVHILAIFPVSYSQQQRNFLLGWLEITGSGDTRAASPKKLGEIFEKIRHEGGIVIVPHPFTQGIGFLDSARKLNIKEDWLESGHVGFMQINDWEKIKYVDRDEDGNWINRYVLASASLKQIRASNYCLAPFNRSDAHKASEISDGCSWFRMAEPSIEGLKQVACEPKTRIAREAPPSSNNNAILGMRVSGGYSDDQFFKFSDGLNCIVGQNYAGKSAVFDFIRFALGLEQEVDAKLRQNLLTRLNGILTPGGSVEVYVRHAGEIYAIKRQFNPATRGEGADLVVVCCNDPSIAYHYDRGQDSLVRIEKFRFPVEVYEQHRISRLRDDVARQLEMLDEFAGIGALKEKRASTIESLNESARSLAPLYDECDQLRSEVGNLAQLEQELTDKEKLIPGQEEQS